MSKKNQQKVEAICKTYNNDRARLMDIVNAVQSELGCIDNDSFVAIANAVNAKRVEVEALVTFYSFHSKEKKGKIVIRLCNDVVDQMQGMDKVAQAFEDELGIKFGETTKDGQFTLEYTPCIGMCDQAPAALINEVVFTYLSSDKAKEIIAELKKVQDPKKVKNRLGDGNNAHALVQSMVHNGLRKKDNVIFGKQEDFSGLKKALSISPAEVIDEIKTSRLRGRGGAGFPTGMKWEFTRAANGDQKYVLCNADEGEPGTFKDRVLLTEKMDLIIEGMAIAGYAIGADTGIIYLRGEYAYLKNFIEKILDEKREADLLGKNVLKKEGFDFDIRLQLGAGAYICGEETSLISSCEGLRGDPKNRPPFPAQKGYLGSPTSVNNVETFCCVARILNEGAAWFAEFGSKGSPGTKLLSVSGDCSSPGVYELPFGITIDELLKQVGAQETAAVLVGGPSGQFIGPNEFSRTICYDDLATGGSIVVFNKDRDLLNIVHNYMEFFTEESCGYCTPCRAGNVLLKRKLEEIMAGQGEPQDLKYLQELGQTIKFSSRCGLGQTSPNPIISTIKNFQSIYDVKLTEDNNKFQPSFDIKAALEDAEEITKRKSVIY